MSDQNMPPTATPSARKPRKWPRVLLAVSLTLNLLVLGLVIGAKAGGHTERGFDPRGPDRGAIRDLGFGPVAGAFDRKDRRAIGRALRERSGSFADNRKTLEGEFNQMLSVLRADPFDAGALAALMDGQSERMRHRGETLRVLVLERISRMSPEERAGFADRIERSVREHRQK